MAIQMDLSQHNQLSWDNGDTFSDVDLSITGRIYSGHDIIGINFTSDNEDLPRFVDAIDSPLVLLVPEVCDDPLVGILHRQGTDYLLKVIQ